jgi:phage terminase large subunit-like protein
MLSQLTLEEKAALNHDWSFWGRPDQQMPSWSDPWFIWMILAGRGWGKTRTAVENIQRMLRGSTPLSAPAGAPRLLSIIADSPFDMRQYTIEGPSGFLNTGPVDCRPYYEPSKKTLTWPNGAKALLFSAEDPETLRGASGSFFWWDELAKSRYAQAGWDNLMFGLREGNPRGIVTTTPRPIPLMKELVKRESTHVTKGSTWDNRDNLAESYYREVIMPKMGTRLGRQEIDAEILDDVPGALWNYGMFTHVKCDLGEFQRVVVAVDPSGAADKKDIEADEIGIAAAGKRYDGTFHVIADWSLRESPQGWGKQTVNLYDHVNADRVVAERNFGGAMVESTIKKNRPNIPVRMVTASRGKAVRAEPISALYEQGRVTHEPGLTQLEDQMVYMTTRGYIGEGSPDRLDAVVWALTELADKPKPETKTTTHVGAF